MRFKQSGVMLPHPNYLANHLERSLSGLSASLKPRQRVSILKALDWLGWQPKLFSTPLLRLKLRRLISIAESNPYSNSYHNPWHTLSVVVLAAILAKRMRFKKARYDDLILLAIAHDLAHRGKRSPPMHLAEERRSATLARRVLRLSGKTARAFEEQIKASAISVRPSHRSKINTLTALLLDADIFASVFFAPKDRLRLAEGIKRETKSTSPSSELLADFHYFISDKHFCCEVKSLALKRGFFAQLKTNPKNNPKTNEARP